MVMNVLARAASLLPPLVLGAAIDSVFTGDARFVLPGVPAARLPTTDAGEFVERGTHDELVREDGLYAALWRARTGDREALADELDG